MKKLSRVRPGPRRRRAQRATEKPHSQASFFDARLMGTPFQLQLEQLRSADWAFFGGPLEVSPAQAPVARSAGALPDPVASSDDLEIAWASHGDNEDDGFAGHVARPDPAEPGFLPSSPPSWQNGDAANSNEAMDILDSDLDSDLDIDFGSPLYPAPLAPYDGDPQAEAGSVRETGAMPLLSPHATEGLNQLRGGSDDAAERRRKNRRLREKYLNLGKKLAAQRPPPPIPAPNIPIATQRDTNITFLVGSAILAHPLRCAPVGFIAQWIMAACPERDLAGKRFRTSIAKSLANNACFAKCEALFTDAHQRMMYFWWV